MPDFIHLYEPGVPMLVMLHGTGGDERDMMAFGQQLRQPGMGILAPRGKEPENGMNRWFRRKAEGVFDLPNLYERADELADYVEEMLPGRERIAVGFSNGANIAAAILLRRPETFKAAMLLAPMVPFEPEELPDLMGVRVHMDCGERDPMVPKENAAKLAGMLSKASARVSVRWHPGGHTLDPEGLQKAKEFLADL
ncbi:alpha/beta hydrolase [bacterium]|nr:MAG: alpha/beta hydrolase [bacterium]